MARSSNTVPLLLSAGVLGGAYLLGKKAADGGGAAPAAPPPGLPTKGTAPKIPPAKPLTGLTTAQSTIIATLLDPRVRADPTMLEEYAKLAGGPDGKQNPGVVGQLFGKAFVMREEAKRAAGATPAFTNPP